MDKEKLNLEVRHELEQLRHVAAQAKRLLAIAETDRREWETVAGAKFVADVWLGVENLCKRRYAAMGSSVPQGPDSHARILEDLVNDPTFRAALTGADLARLKKYLAFRHRFIHGYGQTVTWSMVAEPLRLIPETVDVLDKVWTSWLATL